MNEPIEQPGSDGPLVLQKILLILREVSIIWKLFE